jgi:hypothetical protein
LLLCPNFEECWAPGKGEQLVVQLHAILGTDQSGGCIETATMAHCAIALCRNSM